MRSVLSVVSTITFLSQESVPVAGAFAIPAVPPAAPRDAPRAPAPAPDVA